MRTCPVCGAKKTLTKKTKVYTASYKNHSVNKELNFYECTCCGAKLNLDFEKNNELAIKDAYETARKESVSETLSEIENEISFVELERSFALPPKTLSKWKTKSKAPSAAAAAFVSLLGVFPWLSYIGMTNYDPEMAYKFAGAAFFKELAKNPQNYPFAFSSDNYSVLGIYNEKPKSNTYKENTVIDSSCFGGNAYVD